MSFTDDITHEDGIAWHAAPAPPAKHDHWAQTHGWAGFDQVWRCPCGAISRRGPDGWLLLDEPRVAPEPSGSWWRWAVLVGRR